MDLDELKHPLSKIEGSRSEEECSALNSLVKEIDVKGVILEIGAFKGKTTICLAKAAEEKKEGKVYTIEANFLKTKEDLLRNIDNFGVKDWVIPIFRHSSQISKKWNLPIKLIFIDLDANYLAWVFDYLLWEPHLAVGGAIVFTCASSPGIKKIVDYYIIGSNRFNKLTTIGSIVIAHKYKNSPVYPIWKIAFIRLIYRFYYIIRKIKSTFNLDYNTFAFKIRDSGFKRKTGMLFEGLLKMAKLI